MVFGPLNKNAFSWIPLGRERVLLSDFPRKDEKKIVRHYFRKYDKPGHKDFRLTEFEIYCWWTCPGPIQIFLNSRTSFCALKLCPLIRNSRRLRLKLPNCRLALHKALCYLIACNVPAKIQYRPAADQRAHVCVLKLFWLNLQLLSQEGGELAIRSAASANLGKRWVVWACKNQPLCSSFVHLFVTRVVCLNVAVFKS